MAILFTGVEIKAPVLQGLLDNDKGFLRELRSSWRHIR